MQWIFNAIIRSNSLFLYYADQMSFNQTPVGQLAFGHCNAIIRSNSFFCTVLIKCLSIKYHLADWHLANAFCTVWPNDLVMKMGLTSQSVKRFLTNRRRTNVGTWLRQDVGVQSSSLVWQFMPEKPLWHWQLKWKSWNCQNCILLRETWYGFVEHKSDLSHTKVSLKCKPYYGRNLRILVIS
jgi:hypothetical protein